MTSRRLTAVVAVIVALGFGVIVLAQGWGRQYEGPLGVPDEAVLRMGVPADIGSTWTFGLILLQNTGDSPIVIEDVRADRAKGLLVLGFSAVSSASIPSLTSISPGYPPDGIDPRDIRSAAGFLVPAHPDLSDPAQAGLDVELLIGITVTGTDGASLGDITVDYRVGDKAYRHVYRHDVTFCVPASAPESRDCQPLDPQG